MKKAFYFVLLIQVFTSCDFVLKEHDNDEPIVPANKKVVLGNDKDKQGCVTSAGYKWSEIKKECIRPFDEGYRLNAAEDLKEEGMDLSAFVVFEVKGDKAELFLPNTTKSIILVKEKKDFPYSNGDWNLQPGNGYILTKNGKVMYAGAAIEEQRVVGNDSAEN